MTEQQTIKYAPQRNNMTVDNVTFQTNNVSTVVAYEPFPPADATEQRPLKEFLIKFSVLNGQITLTLDFKTFSSSTGLDYNNGKYVVHPTPEAVKKEFGKIAINLSYIDKISILKNSFPVSWRFFFTFMIQVLSGNYSSTVQVNSIQQLLAYCLITRTEVDIWEIIYSDLVNKLLNKSRLKYGSYPRFISCALQALQGPEYTQDENFGFLPGILSPSNFTNDPSKGPEVPGTLSKKSKRPKSKNPPTETKVTSPKPMEGSEQAHSDELDKERDKEEVIAAGEDMDEDSQVAEEVGTPPPKQDRPEPSHEQHKESAVSYADLKASIEQYYDENIPHRDQTDKLVEASMSSLDKSSTTISDLYKGLCVITQLLRDINNAVKDDPTTNKKTNKAIKIFTKITTQTTEILSLVKTIDFSTIRSVVTYLQAQALKQEEASAAWTKSSTNMAWNLNSIMTAVEISQAALKHEVSSLRQDTLEIKSMMTKIYQAFKSQPSSAPSGSITPTLSLTNIPANVDGENTTTTDTEEPPSHTEGETKDPNMKLVPASTTVLPDLDEEEKVPYTIHGKLYYLTHREIQAYLDKEEKMKKAAEEAKILAMSKPEVIKVVREEAKKLGINTKEAISIKAVPEQASSQTSRRKRKHMELEHEIKVSGLECNRSLQEGIPFVNNMVIEDPEYVIFLTDVFGDQAFQRWNNIYKVGVDSLVSYLPEVIKVVREEAKKLGINPKEAIFTKAVPEQASSQTSKRKRKHMELKHEIKVSGLECNRSLPEGIPKME
nr:copia protein [Tanacetum cinerariifolium]